MVEDKDIERLKEIFVTRQECQEDMAGMDKRIADEMVRLSVIETKLSVITWLLTAVCGGIITVIIKLFLGG